MTLTSGVAYITLLLLLALSLLPRFAHNYKLNRAYLRLVDYLPTDATWIEQALSSPLDRHAAMETGQLFLQNKWSESNTPSLSELQASPSLFKTLSLINTPRQREQLGAFFAALNSISDGEDLQAIDTLSKIRAAGVLLAAGRLLLEAEDLNRALDYLEAAFALQPTSYPILRQLVDAYLAEERFCDLQRVAQIGVEVYDSGLYYYFLGRAYEGLEVWGLAAQAYQEALSRRPGYAPYERLLTRVTQLSEKGSFADLDNQCK